MKQPFSFMIRSLLLFMFLVICTITAWSQHDHHAQSTTSAVPPLSFAPVLNQALADADLKGYTLESTVLTIVPGGADTVAHRHDCDLFGYVLEGEVEIGLEKKAPLKFSTGQMFYEPRNVLHSLARNGSKGKQARVLLMFIIKEGRARYTAEYGKK
jgi:quercetin dioxygenase-like cupin family protein